MQACDRCLRRTWLLDRVSGYLQYERRPVDELLCLNDECLIQSWLGIATRRGVRDELDHEYAEFGPAQAEAARARAHAAGLELICACDPAYPRRLRRLDRPPAVLHVAGGMQRFLELVRADPVAIVGTRRATSYGIDAASLLGRGLCVSGLTVVSGMALGIDAAVHRGALAGGGRTIAVLAGCAAEPYPRQHRHLYNQILRDGVAVSELGVGASPRGWTFVARNRVIAALSRLTIVVQARAGSGALTTAELTRRLGGRLGAVPGPILIAQSEGPHELLRGGAILIGGPQDALDAVCGVGAKLAFQPDLAALSAQQRAVLDAIASGAGTLAELGRSGAGGDELLAALAALELAGAVRRSAGGRYVVAS